MLSKPTEGHNTKETPGKPILACPAGGFLLSGILDRKMPNRIIKESIWTSPNLNKLEDRAEILFYRLLCMPDDHGCFEATPEIIKGKCFPLKDDWSVEDIRCHLASLAINGIIGLWLGEDGRLYGIFKNWHKHQRIRSTHNRKTPEPDINSLNNNDITEYFNSFAVNCRQLPSIDVNCGLNLNPNPNPNLNPNLNKEKEKLKKEKESETTSKSSKKTKRRNNHQPHSVNDKWVKDQPISEDQQDRLIEKYKLSVKRHKFKVSDQRRFQMLCCIYYLKEYYNDYSADVLGELILDSVIKNQEWIRNGYSMEWETIWGYGPNFSHEKIMKRINNFLNRGRRERELFDA